MRGLALVCLLGLLGCNDRQANNCLTWTIMWCHNIYEVLPGDFFLLMEQPGGYDQVSSCMKFWFDECTEGRVG